MTPEEAAEHLWRQYGSDQAADILRLMTLMTNPVEAAETSLNHDQLGGDTHTLRMLGDQLAAKRRGEE
jgi:hypothetical protein